MCNRAVFTLSPLLLLLSTTSSAADTCATPTSETELRELVSNAIVAIDNDDAQGHAEVLEKLETRIPC